MLREQELAAPRRSTQVMASAEDVLVPLIRRLQDGDVKALEPLIRQTERLGMGLAMARLGHRQTAEDVLQDAFLTVFQEIGRLREPAAFRTWFCRIVENRCRRLRRRPLPDPLEDDGLAVSGGNTDLLRRLDLQRAMRLLPEEDRSLLFLREVQSMSYDELAVTLGVPLGTVKSRLAEARRRLLAAWNGPQGAAGTSGGKRRGRPSKMPFASLFQVAMWEVCHVV
ncbi:MAG TPA: RNA polymerase sigma factor [Candidatus Xenobia bacterium]